MAWISDKCSRSMSRSDTSWADTWTRILFRSKWMTCLISWWAGSATDWTCVPRSKLATSWILLATDRCCLEVVEKTIFNGSLPIRWIGTIEWMSAENLDCWIETLSFLPIHSLILSVPCMISLVHVEQNVDVRNGQILKIARNGCSRFYQTYRSILKMIGHKILKCS